MIDSQKSSVRSDAFRALIGNATYSACQLGVLIAVARIGTLHDVGLLALALAVTAPVLLLANLQLRQLLASDAEERIPFGRYFAMRCATTILACFVLLVFALVYQPEEGKTMAIIAMTAAKGVESVGDLIHGMLQRRRQHRIIAGSQMVKGIAGLAAMTLTMYATGDVALGIVAMGCAWIIALVVVDLPAIANELGWAALRPAWEFAALRQLLMKALPMGLVAALLSFASVTPAYLLEHWHGSAALGQFSPVVYLLAIGNLVVLSAGGVALPRLSDLYATGGRDRFTRLTLRLSALAVFVALMTLGVVATIGGDILRVVYGDAYSGSGPMLLILTVAASLGWLATVYGYTLTAAGRLLVQVPLSFAAAIAGVSAGCWLIPHGGLVGAAWSSVIVGAVLATGYASMAVLTIHRMRITPLRGSRT